MLKTPTESLSLPLSPLYAIIQVIMGIPQEIGKLPEKAFYFSASLIIPSARRLIKEHKAKAEEELEDFLNIFDERGGIEGETLTFNDIKDILHAELKIQAREIEIEKVRFGSPSENRQKYFKELRRTIKLETPEDFENASNFFSNLLVHFQEQANYYQDDWVSKATKCQAAERLLVATRPEDVEFELFDPKATADLFPGWEIKDTSYGYQLIRSVNETSWKIGIGQKRAKYVTFLNPENRTSSFTVDNVTTARINRHKGEISFLNKMGERYVISESGIHHRHYIKEDIANNLKLTDPLPQNPFTKAQS